MVNTHTQQMPTRYRPRGATRRYAPADGSSTRGGSTSVRGRVHSPHVAKLQAGSQCAYSPGQLRA